MSLTGPGTIKLHQIYLALDTHQYSKAVKLASALPPHHVLGKALLAHAYQRSGQRYKSLCVIQGLLGTSDWYYEMGYELKRSSNSPSESDIPADNTTTTAAPSTQASTSKRKKGKKQGKSSATNPPAAIVSTAQLPSSTETSSPIHTPPDLMKWLEQLPPVPKNWDAIPVTNDVIAIVDETTLATVAITLQALRLYVTIYQMYAVATNAVTGTSPPLPKIKPQDINTIVTKSFLSGLHLLLEENFPTAQALASMQVASLQLARLATTHDKAPLWAAARTALWQLDFLDVGDEKAVMKQLMLPRLAESLASKAIGIDSSNIGEATTAASAEEYLLYMETLRRQEKFEEVLQLLQRLEDTITSSSSPLTQPGTIPLSLRQIRELTAELLIQMDRNEDASQMYKELVLQYVDQWSYWMEYLRCVNRYSGVEKALAKTEELVEHVIQTMPKESTEPQGMNLSSCNIPRAPHLLKVELAAVRIRGLYTPSSTDAPSDGPAPGEESSETLREAIRTYGELFAKRYSCAFSDVCPYLDILGTSSKEALFPLLEWANAMRTQNYTQDSDTSRILGVKERKGRLRGYIFAVQVSYKVFKLLDSDIDELVDWKELVKEWHIAMDLSSAPNDGKEDSGESAQKENQPGDELILLAVQQLMHRYPSDKAFLVVAAAVVEAGIDHSPHNAYLKIAAMDVYSRCNATSRAWELYQGLSIKHVQLDSCSYLALPMLVDGGLYNESVLESNHVVKLHGSTAKDTGEYMARAMEQGTLSKANEFLLFQRQRMNTSTSLVEAKGRIMDCAPLVHLGVKHKGVSRPLAIQHGIIGGEYDMERISNMVKETHNHYGAPSVLISPFMSKCSVEYYSDNRDFSVLSHEILHRSKILKKEQMVIESTRRGHIHGLLIRVALCADACKGSKKGKVQKTSEVLRNRCDSMLTALNAATDFVRERYTEAAHTGYCELLEATMVLLRVLVMVCAGMPQPSNKDANLASREEQVVDLLPKGTLHLKAAKASLDLASNPQWTSENISAVCRLLPDCIVSLFAIVEINENVFSSFGWGKRKRHTKAGAAAFADFALALRDLVADMKCALLCLPDDLDDKNEKAKEVANDVGPYVECGLLFDEIAKDSIKNVIRAQGVTRDRVVPFLDHILAALDTFDESEEAPPA